MIATIIVFIALLVMAQHIRELYRRIENLSVLIWHSVILKTISSKELEKVAKQIMAEEGVELNAEATKRLRGKLSEKS